jgi:basic membrane protein A
MKRMFGVFAALAILLGLLAGCASPTPEPTAVPTPEPTEAMQMGAGMTVCFVADENGLDDNGLNALAWKGIQRAQDQFGIVGTSAESTATSYEADVAGMVAQSCDLIVSAGPAMAEAMSSAASANQAQQFLLVGAASGQSASNLRTLVFDIDQAAFLAGYLAAGATRTGKIATFGAVEDDASVAAMDAFANGVAYYTKKHEATTTLLGWEPASMTGEFVGVAGITQATESFLADGADILLPLGGNAGKDALKPVADNGQSYAIGSYTDWSRTSSQYADFIMTSILVNADDATLDAIDSLVAGSFSGGEVELGLNDKAVGLASIFIRPPSSSADVASWVDDLKIEVKDLEAGVASGEVDISG